MHIDIAQHIGAVTRKVSSRNRDGQDTRLVVASRLYRTTPDDLWDALTSADRLPRWFLPVTGDLRLGGRYQLQGNAGGEILTCQPPRHLKLTWEFGGKTSWLEVHIADHADGAQLTLEHEVRVDDHWQQFGAGATGVGWDLALVGLGQHVAGSMPNAEAGMAWMMSDNGKTFIRESSETWGLAAIASGESSDAAKAAASRTTAAFTGS